MDNIFESYSIAKDNTQKAYNAFCNAERVDNKELYQSYKEAQAKEHALEIAVKVERYNEKNRKLATLCNKVFAVFFTMSIDEILKITTNNGKFHKNKVKKFGLIVDFLENHKYTRVKFNRNFLTGEAESYSLEIGIDNIVLFDYKDNKLDTPEKLLKRNGVTTALTLEGVTANIEALMGKSKELSKVLETHSDFCESQNVYLLEKIGVINRSTERVYIYK